MKIILTFLLFTLPVFSQSKKELDVKSTFCINLGDEADTLQLSSADGEEIPSSKGSLFWIECPNGSFLGMPTGENMLAAFVVKGKVTMLRLYLNGKQEAQAVSKKAGRYPNCTVSVQFKRGHYYADFKR